MDYVRPKNVVCTATTGVKWINCKHVAATLHGRWDSGVFPAMVSHCRNKKTTLSLFSTNRLVIVGCDTADTGNSSGQMLIDVLVRTMPHLYGRARLLNFEVCNIVCRVELPWRLNLDLLYADACIDPDTVAVNPETLQGGCTYEPEVFPSLAWPIQRDGVAITFALFQTGKGVATGLRTMSARHVANTILHTLSRYEIGNEYRALRPDEIQNRKAQKRSRKERRKAAAAAAATAASEPLPELPRIEDMILPGHDLVRLILENDRVMGNDDYDDGGDEDDATPTRRRRTATRKKTTTREPVLNPDQLVPVAAAARRAPVTVAATDAIRAEYQAKKRKREAATTQVR
jgi:TATA-box binding protein (TBP) (component of TFIID and TFIIIB)